MAEPVSDYRTLVKSKHYIDLPGESPKSKLWPGVNNLIIIRKQRDVVFDIKLGNGATYTVTTDQPRNEYSRFYDPKRNLNVTKITFQDGEPCHIWLGRTFQGSLILKQGDKVLGSYPIRGMDCTQGCTEDPKDKPAPMLIIMHSDKAWAKELIRISDASGVGRSPLSQSLVAPLDRARQAQAQNSPGSLPGSPLNPPGSVAAPMNGSPAAIAGVSSDGYEFTHSVQMFCVKQSEGLGVPEAVSEFFMSGDQPYKFQLNPHDVISRNWILNQMGNVGMYIRDTWFGDEPWARQFWNRAFYLVKRAGQKILMFSTGPEDYKVLGVLLVGYKREVQPGTKLMAIAGGAGTLSSAGSAAWSAAKGSFAGNSLIAFFIGAGIDFSVWYNDPSQDFRDLLAILIVDAGKAMLVGAAISGINAAIVGLAGTFGAGVGVIAVGGFFLIVTVGLIVDYFLDASGKKFLKLLLHSPKGAGAYIGDEIKKVGVLLEEKLPKDYGDTYSDSQWTLLP